MSGSFLCSQVQLLQYFSFLPVPVKIFAPPRPFYDSLVVSWVTRKRNFVSQVSKNGLKVVALCFK